MGLEHLLSARVARATPEAVGARLARVWLAARVRPRLVASVRVSLVARVRVRLVAPVRVRAVAVPVRVAQPVLICGDARALLQAPRVIRVSELAAQPALIHALAVLRWEREPPVR